MFASIDHVETFSTATSVCFAAEKHDFSGVLLSSLVAGLASLCALAAALAILASRSRETGRPWWSLPTLAITLLVPVAQIAQIVASPGPSVPVLVLALVQSLACAWLGYRGIFHEEPAAPAPPPPPRAKPAPAEPVSRPTPTPTLHAAHIGLLRILETAWTASEDGIMVASPKPSGVGVQIVYTNPAFERITGYSSAEVAGQSTSNLYETDLGPFVPDAVRTAMQGQSPVRIEVPMRRKTHQPVWTEWQVFPVSNVHDRHGDTIVVIRDITEKRRAESEAQGSRDFVGSMLEHLPALVSVTDAEDRIHLVNPAWVRTTKVPAEQATGRRISEVLPQATAQILARHAQAVRSTGRAIRGKTVLDLGRGVRNYVTVQFLLPSGLVGVVFVDVTDQTRAEEALRQSEERYRMLFDGNPYPMWVYDEQSLKILAVNEPAMTAYGYTREEFLGMTLRDIAPTDDVQALASTPPPSPGSSGRLSLWRHRTKAGVLREIEATSHCVQFGSRAARLIVASDITERKRAEKALRQQEDLLKNILSHVPCGVYWKDRASIYLGCNDRFAQDVGLTVPGEIVGITDYELGIDAEQAEFSREIDRHIISSGEPVLNEEEVRSRRDGTKQTLLSSRVPFRDTSGAVTGVVGAYLDITDRKRLEEQFRQAQKMEAIGRLAGGIAHDFRNLLTVIIGNTELLRESNHDEEELRMMSEIAEAAEQGANLVRQLLTFSRPQQAKLEVIDLARVVQGTSGMVRRLLGRILVVFECPDHPVYITADRGQIEQIVMNLVVNARDAMPTGGRLRMAISTMDTPTPMARLSIADTGCGMSAEIKDKIFDPFFTTKGPDKGTGLGLAVVQGIVKQAKGMIAVESTPGEGTTFHITFPRVDSPDGRNLRSSSANLVIPASMTGRNSEAVAY